MDTKKFSHTQPLIDVLTDLLEQLNAGYNPPFAFVIVPDANGKDVHCVSGCTAGNILHARALDKHINDGQEAFRNQFMMEALGVDENEIDEVVEQLSRDLRKAAERAADRLKKDPPIRNTSDAKRLLAELMRKK